MPVFELVLRFLGAIVALAFVLFLAWLTLRFMNKRVPGFGTGTGRMIKILDRVGTGRGSSLMLIRIQDKVMLIAQSEHAIEKLCEFDDPENLIVSLEPENTMDFSAALKDAVAKFGQGKQNKPDKGGDE